MKLLIANRGEIAVRVVYAAQDLGFEAVTVHSEDDTQALHTRLADDSIALVGRGPRAYLDIDQIIAKAVAANCDAIHPGYGFLSENADFADVCNTAGLTFVGPTPDTLRLFGNKVNAKAFVQECNVPTIPGIAEPVSLEQASEFMSALNESNGMLLKAINGGGGRGIRVVSSQSELQETFARAASEAEVAFGDDKLYIESQIDGGRHVEVQILGDGQGGIMTLGTRDCSLQRRHQKIIEIAPAVGLSAEIEAALIDASRRIGEASKYRSLGTLEFLVLDDEFFYLECNARLQVEHTVTEVTTGFDLVQLQLQLAEKGSIPCTDNIATNGVAVQSRVNMETIASDGSTRPSGGTLKSFAPPTGVGVRVDTFGYPGYTTNASFDSLLAKVIASGSSVESAIRRSRQALLDFEIAGVKTNRDFLSILLDDPNVASFNVHTRYVDEHTPAIVEQISANAVGQGGSALAGVKLQSDDPLAVLALGKSGDVTPMRNEPEIIEDLTPVPDGTVPVRAPMQGTIVELPVEVGDDVGSRDIAVIMEAMKMEHEIRVGTSGKVVGFNVEVGDSIYENHALLYVEETENAGDDLDQEQSINLDESRRDVDEVLERHEITLDKRRPDAVEKRRKTKQRTARENIDQLCDPGTFSEYGQLVLTPGTGLPLDEVIRKFPTDGMVTGIGSINGSDFGENDSRSLVMAYDYTVLAGTQGTINHPKTDRMLELAARWQLPVVLFAEGGGGRAGTGGRRNSSPKQVQSEPPEKKTYFLEDAKPRSFDAPSRPMDTPTFASMGRLSGLVPLVGITSRYCFAGNAALLGCCDVIIATENSNIGMGGPALIEGGNLGVFRPEEVGPLSVQRKNGVVDIVAKDEQHAVEITKQYLSYFQGTVSEWEADDQRKLRHIVPENRLRIYDIRQVIESLADKDSVLELRPEFGLGMVTAFVRIEGRPIGVIANNPNHLSGAIDSDGSDNAARFLQLCDAFDIPILILCDTPGMMVGPEIEKTALVRHCSRLFVTGANLTVPTICIVLRKAYGLGAQAMAGGSFKDPFAVVAWPTAEFGGMGLEGQVKLGYRNELEAMTDPEERRNRYDFLVESAYQRGKALVAGQSFAVDDVIDPADSRRWITTALNAAPKPTRRKEKKRSNVDTW